MVANANARVFGHCDFGVILSIFHGAETLGKGVFATISPAYDQSREPLVFSVLETKNPPFPAGFW